MALDASVFQNLQPPKPVDLIGPYMTMAELRLMHSRQQDIDEQVQQRHEAADRDRLRNLKEQQATKETQDYVGRGGKIDDSDPNYAGYRARIYAIDRKGGEELDTVQANLKKTRAETLAANTAAQKSQQEIDTGSNLIKDGSHYNFDTKQWEPLPQNPLQIAQTGEANAAARQKNAEATVKELEAGTYPQTVDEYQAKLNALAPPQDKTFADTNKRFAGVARAGQYTPAIGANLLKQAASEAEKISVAKNTVPFKVEVQQAGAGNVSGGGLDLAAQAYLQNQTLPGRNPLLNSKIMNRAAEIAKEHGMDATAVVIARNAAAANKEALNKITTQQAQVEGFSQTAEKNMRILETAMNQVSDLGAPVLNTPIRNLQSKFAGNPKVAALNAALAPVQAEVAKILNSVNATGGSLTDTSRGEMQAVLNGGATPAQLKAALDIFRQDIANRKSTYEALIQETLQKSAVVAPKKEPDSFIIPGGALDKLLHQ